MVTTIIQSPYEASVIEIGELSLESGKKLKNVQIAYERVGSKEAPVILVCHALTGNQFAVGTEQNPGWWSGLIGPDKAINTQEFQVITMNVIGGCDGSTGPLTIDPDTGNSYRANFPFISIRDMVHAQYLALKKLKIDHVKAIIGGSLGGMQVLEWGVLYPDFMDTLILLAVTPYLSDYAIAYNLIARLAIINDPAWNQGDYLSNEQINGLKIARMVGMVTYRSAELFNARFQRAQHANWGIRHDETTFEVESYLRYQGEKLTRRFDANSYLYLLKAMDRFDLGKDRGDWRKALELMEASMIAIGFRGDLLYPPKELEQLVEHYQKIGGRAKFIEVDTQFGHDGFLVEFEKWAHLVREGIYGID
ncbi:homoserine O-acetyltransferase MetX [Tepidibacillus fermentans]|uniref:Homoserine O-acetyltransferase n=1 Tax=Tepidibacillus fermentans TaxID=1281767 RepID=A0A4R3KFX1_9BACI|nr:homoserine O-acetyltransferase [Tepidibacillus fermentans]TCS82110.1 homoserine O-acetyltransferase [Tepidibacillus fermentans]